ncbi:MAG TPA: WG repeat-containing protein, partial [Bacteroidia bacterium]|nr:WG repeat-containing protein [Bacteroidia bacterium]
INIFGEVIVPAAKQTILIRGNIIKIIKPDSSATFLQTDEYGRIIDKSDYDEFRVIKVGGSEAPITILDTVRMPVGSTLLPMDSLQWYSDPVSSLWGMRNIFTGVNVITPQFYYVNSIGGGMELVAIQESVYGIHVDDMVTVARERVGVVNNKTGQIVLQPNYANVLPSQGESFSGYVRAVLQDGSMALVSTDGSERAIKCTWIEELSDGYARFCIDGKYSVESGGETVCKLSLFAVQQNLDPKKSFGIASTSEQYMDKTLSIAGGKWGYMDSTGTITVAATYDGAHKPIAKTGIVKSNKKWGLVDMSGGMILPCTFDGLSYLQTDSSTMVIAQTNGVRYGYLDAKGNIVINADLKKSKSLGSGFIAFSRTGKWGVMNTKGETVLPETYADILSFSEGKAAVKLGGKWGFIDTSGTQIVPLKYERAGDFHEGMARVVYEHKWGYINDKGLMIIQPKFLQAGNFSGKSAPVKTKDGFGLVGKDGNYIIQPSWAKIVQLDSNLRGFFLLRNDFVYGICKSDGKVLLAPRFEQYIYLGQGRISYRSATKFGIMDTTGRVITATIFDNVHGYSENFAAAAYDSKWGYIDLMGKFVIEPQYEIAGKFYDHSAYTYLENGYAQFLDTTGNIVYSLGKGTSVLLGYSEGKYVLGELDNYRQIKDEYYLTRHGVHVNRFTYKEALAFDSGLARVRPSGNLWGLISYTGYYVAKPKFSLIAPFADGLARFQMLNTNGLYSIDGKAILPVNYDGISYDSQLKMIRFEKDSSVGYLFPDGRVCWPESE